MRPFIDVIEPHLGPELVSPSALRRIRAAARSLPPVSLAGFECHLGGHGGPVDFQLRLRRGPLHLPDRVRAGTGWTGLVALCDAWERESGSVPEALDALLAIWVELDLEEGGADLPGPSLFFEIAPSSGPELFDALLSSFAIESSPGERWEQALYLVETAPARARLSHVALMLGRPGAPVRFRICDLAPAGLGPYLARLGLEAAATALETSGLLLDPAPDSTAILLDAGSEGRVGVECFFEEGNSPGWKSFLDRLEKMALATGTEIEALRRWPGLQTRDRARTWPESFALGDALLVDRALSVFWRSVNHIKVDFDPAAEPAAKAYLAFGHRWVKCPDTGGLPAASGG